MCNFCNKQKPKYIVDNSPNKKVVKNDSIAESFNLIIEGNKLMVEYDAYSTDSSFNEEIQIKYCPMCGRSL